MIKSWIAYALSVVAVVGLGFVKSLWIPTYPLEPVITGIVALAGFYFTKRVAPRVVGAWRSRPARGGMSED